MKPRSAVFVDFKQKTSDHPSFQPFQKRKKVVAFGLAQVHH